MDTPSYDGKMDGDEVHNLYPTPNIVTVTKSKMLRLAGHVARKREIKIEQEFIQKT
jgi:hypothetical protein